MKPTCIGCGERPSEKNSSLCATCTAEFTAEMEAPRKDIKPCGRPAPWPACRCPPCTKALDAAFRRAAKLHAKMRAHGKKVLSYSPIPPKWRDQITKSKTGRCKVPMEFSLDEVTLIEQAVTLSGLTRVNWLRRAVRRQSWLELHGEAAIVKRLDDLTRVVAKLLEREKERDAQRRRVRDPQPK